MTNTQGGYTVAVMNEMTAHHDHDQHMTDAGHENHDAHAGHSGHAGHGDHVGQFRRLFWWNLLLAIACRSGAT